jgi:hypothetical protein
MELPTIVHKEGEIQTACSRGIQHMRGFSDILDIGPQRVVYTLNFI